MTEPTNPPGLPRGVSRRQFLEDVLDCMGDAQEIVHWGPDGAVEWTVSRAELLDALAREMRP